MKPCEGFVFDVDRLPLIITRFPPRKTNREDWLFYTRFIEDLFRNQTKFYWIIDIREASIQDPALLYKTVVWVKENRQNFERYCYGCAYVMNNAIIKHSARLFLNTMGAGKIMGPIAFFDQDAQAVEWGTHHLVKEGIRVPTMAN
jgi:hypothetical protein